MFSPNNSHTPLPMSPLTSLPIAFLLLTSHLLHPTTSSSPDEVDDVDEFDPSYSAPVPFTSSTTCSFAFPSDGTTTYPCEYSRFGPLPFVGSPLLSKLALPPSSFDLGCPPSSSSWRPDLFEGRVLVLSRGSCTFYAKALAAQSAGASGLIVYDTEGDVDPVRMKGTGEEVGVVKIPAVMISREGGEQLLRALGELGLERTGAMGMTLDLSERTDEGGNVYGLVEEYERKRDLSLADYEGAEEFMQLGALFSRLEWGETASVYLRHAETLVTDPADYDVVFSIGEYFHNVEEAVDAAQHYFKRAGLLIVDVLLDEGKGKEVKKEARERLIDAVGIIPDGPAQREVLEKMRKEEMYRSLKFVIKRLLEEKGSQLGDATHTNSLGTTALLLDAVDRDSTFYSGTLLCHVF